MLLKYRQGELLHLEKQTCTQQISIETHVYARNCYALPIFPAPAKNTETLTLPANLLSIKQIMVYMQYKVDLQ